MVVVGKSYGIYVVVTTSLLYGEYGFYDAVTIPSLVSAGATEDKAAWHLFTELNSYLRLLSEFDTFDEAATYFTDALHSAVL